MGGFLPCLIVSCSVLFGYCLLFSEGKWREVKWIWGRREKYCGGILEEWKEGNCGQDILNNRGKKVEFKYLLFPIP